MFWILNPLQVQICQSNLHLSSHKLLHVAIFWSHTETYEYETLDTYPYNVFQTSLFLPALFQKKSLSTLKGSKKRLYKYYFVHHCLRIRFPYLILSHWICKLFSGDDEQSYDHPSILQGEWLQDNRDWQDISQFLQQLKIW